VDPVAYRTVGGPGFAFHRTLQSVSVLKQSTITFSIKDSARRQLPPLA